MKILIDTNKPEQVAELLDLLKKKDTSTKPTPEARFAELIQELEFVTNKSYPDSEFYFKGKDVYFEHDKKTKYLWCDYDKIWSVFEKEYGMKYEEIQVFIKEQVTEHLKLKDITPYC